MNWISCKNRLPNVGESVLITTTTGQVYPAVFRRWDMFGARVNGMLDYWSYRCEEVKAWMPLPEAYEEDKKCG